MAIFSIWLQASTLSPDTPSGTGMSLNPLSKIVIAEEKPGGGEGLPGAVREEARAQTAQKYLAPGALSD